MDRRRYAGFDRQSRHCHRSVCFPYVVSTSHFFPKILGGNTGCGKESVRCVNLPSDAFGSDLTIPFLDRSCFCTAQRSTWPLEAKEKPERAIEDLKRKRHGHEAIFLPLDPRRSGQCSSGGGRVPFVSFGPFWNQFCCLTGYTGRRSNFISYSTMRE